ncbi:MAG: SDR family oxidoreductase [Chlamydiae bacterium]|nr:SDR family oxidoreductase [Chlamydiota bacterium]
MCKNFIKILVAGGAGYVGSKLVPALINKGYDVKVLDLYMYGKDLFQEYRSSGKLSEVVGDIRDLKLVEEAIKGCDTVIHLACISNDPSFELNPKLGKSINLDAFEPFVKLAKKHKVQRFIYASSSSVYGVKKELNVTEDMTLEPLTDYSRFKADCEKILLKYKDDNFICTVLRPSTVCGYAPRQRLDLVVNILTNLAYNTGKVKVMGGDQMRPNIHIDDMVRAYIHVLEAPKNLIQGEIFNVGYHNHTVLALGEMIKKIVGKKKNIEMEVVPSNDNRSYHVNSDKISKKLGFTPKFTIENAIEDLIDAFEKGKLPNSLDDKRYFNIATMKAINLE